MNIRLRPGDASTPGDLHRVQQRIRMLRGEIARVRAAAVSWRNGLGALLTSLVGFGLITGRANIGELERGWAVAVGAVLLAAAVAGTGGALLLLRAAHGPVAMVTLTDLPSSPVADRREAAAAVRALRVGRILTLACAGLLMAAIAITWYGPPQQDPRLTVVSPGLDACGTVARLADGVLTLSTARGDIAVRLDGLLAMAPVERCG